MMRTYGYKAMRTYGYKAISSVGRRPLTDLKRLGHEGSMAGMHHMRVAGAIPPALQRNHSDEEETGPLANLAKSRCCEALAFFRRHRRGSSSSCCSSITIGAST